MALLKNKTKKYLSQTNYSTNINLQRLSSRKRFNIKILYPKSVIKHLLFKTKVDVDKVTTVQSKTPSLQPNHWESSPVHKKVYFSGCKFESYHPDFLFWALFNLWALSESYWIENSNMLFFALKPLYSYKYSYRDSLLGFLWKMSHYQSAQNNSSFMPLIWFKNQ